MFLWNILSLIYHNMNQNKLDWLRTGINLSGKQPDEKPVSCQYCFPRFTSMAMLMKHHKSKKDARHKGKPVRRVLKQSPKPKPFQHPNDKNVPPAPPGVPPVIPKKKPPHRKGGRSKGVPRSGARSYRQKLTLGKEYSELKKGEKIKWRKKT